jgi:DNA modification methylase
MSEYKLYTGDAIEVMRTLPDESVNCIVTSPPYFALRDYGAEGQLGLEATPAAYVESMVRVFREARRVLRNDGTLWLNIGDSYANSVKAAGVQTGKHAKGLQGKERAERYTGMPGKSLIGIPFRLAFGLQDDGWILRADIIWHKPNGMPDGATDRPTRTHEYVFLFSKAAKYWYDAEPLKERAVYVGDTRHFRNDRAAEHRFSKGRREHTGKPQSEYKNGRSVWSINTQPTGLAHFATMPKELARRCISAGCPKGGVVLDMFGGTGTTGIVARELERNSILIDINPEYTEIQRRRFSLDYQPRLLE